MEHTAAEPLRTGAPSQPRPRRSGRSETRVQPRPHTRVARSCRRPPRRGGPIPRHARRARRLTARRAPHARVPGRATLFVTPELVALLRSFGVRVTEDEAHVN